MKRFRLSLMLICFTFFVSIAYAQTGTLTVQISEIQGNEGKISVGLYTNAENFPNAEKTYKGQMVEVTGEKAVATFKDIPAGTYGVAVFHDANSNGELDTNFLGIPNEGYAFSNNVFGTFGPPDFEDVTFALDGDKTIEIKMGY